MRSAIHAASLCFNVLLCALAANQLLAANAPMSPAQMALYQGADQEKILI